MQAQVESLIVRAARANSAERNAETAIAATFYRLGLRASGVGVGAGAAAGAGGVH